MTSYFKKIHVQMIAFFLLFGMLYSKRCFYFLYQEKIRKCNYSNDNYFNKCHVIVLKLQWLTSILTTVFTLSPALAKKEGQCSFAVYGSYALFGRSETDGSFL